MALHTPYLQVGTNAKGGCCWQVVILPGLVVDVASGADAARVLHCLKPPVVR
jgi:hypothetical protein